MNGTSAVLLAAGRSSRMGSLKATLPWRGTTLIEHQIRSLLDAGVDEVIVVLGHEANRLLPIIEAIEGAKRVVNTDY